ncbi:MAG TPA: hypothetical protein VJ890_22380 [Vineibacter sp.]|nr:hypothetical protein [Vineibacter sp.]
MSEFTDRVELRQFVQRVLLSTECQKVSFRYDGREYHGLAFAAVAHAMNPRPGSMGHISIDVKPLPAGTGAQYLTHSNTMVFPPPAKAFGLTPFDRASIVHESVHAVRDGWGVKPTRGARYQPGGTRAVNDEAAAFIAGALYDIHWQTPGPGSTPTRPAWSQNLTHPFGIAWTLAQNIWQTPGATVSDNDAAALRAAITSLSPTYNHIQANPNVMYANDGWKR